MSADEQVQLKSRGLQRCPFCHEALEPERTEWVACSQCLARHHPGCWEEGGACSSCGNDQTLVRPGTATDTGRVERPAARVGEAVGAPVLTEQERLDEVRRQTAALLGKGPPPHWFPSVVGALLTLGLAPVVRAELDLRAHRLANSREHVGPLPPMPTELAADVTQARNVAFGDGFLGSVGRAIPALAMACSLFVVGIAVAEAIDHSYHADRHLAVAAFFQLWVAGFANLYLNLHRETVARHEARQTYVSLVEHAVPPGVSSELSKAHAARWNVRRVQDVVLGLFTLIPGLGLLLMLLGRKRMRGALAEHEQHEADLEAAIRAHGRLGGKPAADR